MSIALEQIKADIKSGKSKAIYLSDKFLWWTHLESDLLEASQMGFKYLTKDMISVPAINYGYLDPIGSKIITNKDPHKFIIKTLLNPKHYGKHKIAAFLKAHHQNCNNFYSNKWDGYNKLIDRERNGNTNGSIQKD